MKKRNWYIGGGAAVLGVALIALPGHSASQQNSADARLAQLERKVEELQSRLAERLAGEQDRVSRAQERLAESLAAEQERIAERESQARERAAEQVWRQAEVAGALAQEVEQEPEVKVQDEPDSSFAMVLGDEGASWLGVESREVNAENAKDLKLPAERGVLLDRIVPDSPAAKAGLKEHDVITEINGQRVEGETQFRRMIHEIPAGRAAQFTVWRDGRSQAISVTLGKSEDRTRSWFGSTPRAFSFELPKVEIPDIEVMPGNGWGYGLLAGARPRLGIDAEDLSGQFGTYFGAPDGEGVLVREVNSGSPAEKAGVKTGDVITSVNGERVRSLGELRERLAAKRDEKTVKLSVLRNKSEMSVTVELPPPPSKASRTLSHRTNI